MSTSLNHVYNYVQLLNHLARIIEQNGGKKPELDLTDDEFRPHEITYLKLLLLMSYSRAFLDIGSRHTDLLFYLDVLSASGLSYTQDREDPIPGSCFVVPLAMQEFEHPEKPPSHGFSKVWVFDQNEKRLDAILERHQALQNEAGLKLPEFEKVSDDANTSLVKIIDEIEKLTTARKSAGKRRPLTLAFIDNIGLNVEMQTIADMQGRIRADLIIHLPTSAIWRCVRAFQEAGQNEAILDRFFGDQSWKTIMNAQEVPATYNAAVRKATGEDFQDFDPVRIKGLKAEFSLCVYVRKTKGTQKPYKPGWVNKIRSLADACNQVDHDHFTNIQAAVFDRQQSLGKWME